MSHEIATLPRGEDLDRRLEAVRNAQSRFFAAHAPTNTHFKIFLPLLLQEKPSPDLIRAWSTAGGQKGDPKRFRRFLPPVVSPHSGTLPA